jgi:hypothetical protein
MSILDGAMPRPAGPMDEAMERRLAALFSHVEPDPLFSRRMRSQAVNRFVAAREGIAVDVPDRSVTGAMGSLGRACLYASFVLGAGAASVLAASQEALPAEPLYGLKLRIEQVRMEILPGHLHEQLAINALTERIDEMARLADAGNAEGALALAPAVEASLQQVAEFQATADTVRVTDGVEQQLVVLDALIERLPEQARSAVHAAIDGVPGLHLGRGDAAQSRGGGRGSEKEQHASGAAGQAAGGIGLSVPVDGAPTQDVGPEPQAMPAPDSADTSSAPQAPSEWSPSHAAKASATPNPNASPASEASARPRSNQGQPR